MKYISASIISIILFYTGIKTKNLSNKLAVSPQAYQVKVCDYYGESSEGGEIKGYYVRNEIKKIEVILYGELGKVIKEFSMSDNISNSFKFKQKHYYYNKPFYYGDYEITDSSTIIGVTINKKVIADTILGKKIDEISLSKIYSNLNSNKEKYTQFLIECKNEN